MCEECHLKQLINGVGTSVSIPHDGSRNGSKSLVGAGGVCMVGVSLTYKLICLISLL